jgi:tetratricopeptide (TPR) repeat protein
MPTHIFIQLGMWNQVSTSNQSAYQVAVDLWEPGDVAGDMVHALDWGQYGDLQRGDYEKAALWIERMEGIAQRNLGQARVQGALPRVKARFVLETRQWQTQPVTDKSSAVELLATGISAIKLGNLGVASEAAGALQKLVDATPKDTDSSYYSRTSQPLMIMHNELAGLLAVAHGETDAGLQILADGVAIAESMRPPNGAPNPVKPVHEIYGEALLAAGRLPAATAQFEKSLQRTPNRPLSLLGLARTEVAAGNAEAGRAHYKKLAEVWKDRDFPALQEANQYLASREGE